MGELNQYKEWIFLLIAFGGYVVFLERRLTKVETLLKTVCDDVQRLINIYGHD